MNKRTFLISTVIVSALALSCNAFGQPPGSPGRGVPMGGPGGGIILWHPEVIRGLELTPEQTSELQRIMADMRTQRPPGTPPTGPPNPEERRQRMDEMQAKVQQVLNSEQQVKLREIAFKLAGGLDSRLLDDRMLEVVNLTDGQKGQIREIMAKREARNRTAIQDFNVRSATREEREKFRTDAETRVKEYRDRIKAVLTAEQKAKAEKLTAEAPALRERLGMTQPGQRVQRQVPPSR